MAAGDGWERLAGEMYARGFRYTGRLVFLSSPLGFMVSRRVSAWRRSALICVVLYSVEGVVSVAALRGMLAEDILAMLDGADGLEGQLVDVESC